MKEEALAYNGDIDLMLACMDDLYKAISPFVKILQKRKKTRSNAMSLVNATSPSLANATSPSLATTLATETTLATLETLAAASMTTTTAEGATMAI